MPEENSNVVSLEERKRNAKRISKADVLATAEKLEEEYIEEIDLLVPMRRLDDTAATDIQAAMSDGVKVERDGDGNVKNMEIDVARQIQGERYGRRTAIAQSLTTEQEVYTVEEVAKFPPDYVSAISDRIFTLSGMNQEQQEEIENFRENEGGREDSVDAPAGGAAGEESAGADAATGYVSGGGAPEGGADA